MVVPNSKKLIRFSCLGVFFCIVLVVLFDYMPLYKKICYWEGVQIEKLDKSKTIEVEDEVTISNLKDELTDLNETFIRFKTLLKYTQEKSLKEKNIPMITLTIEDMAESTGTELISVRPLVEQQEGQYEILPIEINLRSRYDEFCDFLSKVELSESIAAIESINVQVDELDGAELEIQLTPIVLFLQDET